MEKDYEQMVSDLLNWLNSKIVKLGQPFQKSMIAVQREMATFKHFRTVEKPPKYVGFQVFDGPEMYECGTYMTLVKMLIVLIYDMFCTVYSMCKYCARQRCLQSSSTFTS